MKTLHIVIIVILVALAGAFAFQYMQPSVPAGPGGITSIEGCYVANLAKDVYTLEVQSESNGEFNGTLEFDNFEKDSSSGTFNGTYSNGILLGDYSFASEGTNSVMQVAFKKTEGGFMRGFGPVNTEDNKVTFTDVNQLAYQSPVFEYVSCR